MGSRRRWAGPLNASVGVAHIADVAKGMRGMCLKRQQKVHKKISETIKRNANQKKGAQQHI